MPLYTVACFAEAWIEIADNFSNPILGLVASFAEAWIEICDISPALISLQVASFAEAWIEIMISFLVIFPGSRRLLRGGVD